MTHVLTYKGYDIYQNGKRFEVKLYERYNHRKYVTFSTIESAKQYIDKSLTKEIYKSLLQFL